jgi:hypothetical protein
MKDFVEPYPTEIPKIHHAFSELTRRFSNKKFTDSSVDEFRRAAVELFGQAGFEVDVAWDEVRQNGIATGLYMPEVTICGRIRNEIETDHERMQWEITHGLLDGKAGYVREDGTLREDPKKKQIG